MRVLNCSFAPPIQGAQRVGSAEVPGLNVAPPPSARHSKRHFDVAHSPLAIMCPAFPAAALNRITIVTSTRTSALVKIGQGNLEC